MPLDDSDWLRDGFDDPPADDFGNVPFWWWDGDELTQERITDQLETLSEQGVEAVCFEQKYPHGPPEGVQVRYFSDEWWKYMTHTVEECDRLGMNLWIHDLTYHHSPPSWKRYWQDRAEEASENLPDLQGHVLAREGADVSGGETATLELEEEFTPLSVAAYPRDDDGRLSRSDAVQLESNGGRVEWTADEGDWHVAAIGYRPEGLSRTTPDVVDWIIENHYEEYVDRVGDAFGDAIEGTFQDELYILEGTIPCDERLLARHRAEWGEDPVPDLIALFEDCSEGVAGFRTRYYDVLTTMLEENWFRPLYEWHERRGLRFAHDNYGRNDLTAHATEYGDYFRTMRWFQEPGYDDGRRNPETVGERNFFDGKVASSIAECYGRERVWGELYHTTGWGYPPELQYGCAAEHVTYGLNHYNKHGLYYSTLGGWYEHAPPDTHFRQPYWEHADAFNDALTRLMYLFSQGDLVADLALLYPITSIQANWRAGEFDAGEVVGGRSGRYRTEEAIAPEGRDIDERSREIAETLFDDVADILVVDHDTLDDAAAVDSGLAVAGAELPVLVLGPVSTVRRSVLERASEFVRNGGVVASIGSLPTATVEGGEGDDRLESALSDVFGDRSDGPVDQADEPIVVEHDGGGIGIQVGDPIELDGLLDQYVDRDVLKPDDVYHTHRRVGDSDVYLLLNTADEERTVDVSLRADGRPELWDPQTGDVESLDAYSREDPYTTIEFDFAPWDFHVVVFEGDGADAGPRVTETTLSNVTDVDSSGERSVVTGHATESGTHTATVETNGVRRDGTSESVDVPEPISIAEDWTFELEPTLDNRWGDFRYPASDDYIGPEVRSFLHRSASAGDDPASLASPDGDDGDWEDVRWSYGPRFWRRTETDADTASVATPDEDRSDWEPYVFSTDVGKPGTHSDDHGFNGVVSDDFLVSPEDGGRTHFWTAVHADEDTQAACHYGDGIVELSVNGESLPVSTPDEDQTESESADGIDWLENVGESPQPSGGTTDVALPEGTSFVHLVVEPDTKTHVALEPRPATARDQDMTYVPRLRWFHGSDAFEFDHRPWEDEHADWFAFELPVGTTAFTLPVDGDARVWVDGDESRVSDERVELDGPLSEPASVAVWTADEGGAYSGAMWSAPVEIETEPVSVDAGDWRDLGHESYSGIGVYRRTVDVPDLEDGDRVVLDLGEVAVSASVSVNGTHVDKVFSRPFEVDVTEAVERGENDVEVRVANTVANHLETETPTRYVFEGQRRSGLHGPVSIRVERGVRVETE